MGRKINPHKTQDRDGSKKNGGAEDAAEHAQGQEGGAGEGVGWGAGQGNGGGGRGLVEEGGCWARHFRFIWTEFFGDLEWSKKIGWNWDGLGIVLGFRGSRSGNCSLLRSAWWCSKVGNCEESEFGGISLKSGKIYGLRIVLDHNQQRDGKKFILERSRYCLTRKAGRVGGITL
jgi:hypothetical protein